MKDVLVSGIKVEHQGVDDYYGFTIDGNGRFVLGNYIVTHNTELARATANELGLETGVKVFFYSITPNRIRSKWEGGTEKNIVKIFDDAKNKAKSIGGGLGKSILFFDEVEAIAGSREEEKIEH